MLLDDAEVRAAGFRELAALTIPAASVANSLGLRMGEAGMAWADVAALVPETGPLLDVALETRRLGGPFGPPLSTMIVARPAVRSEDPVVELGDRLARLHRVAWQLTQQDRVGICTLADLAVAGIVVNENAARVMRHFVPDLDSGRASARFEEGATAWRLVHQQIRQLRTTTPALPGLRADIVWIRQLLDQLVGTDGSPRLQATVVGGARAFADVAMWNSQVIDHVARRGDLFIPGLFLTGNEVSNHPTLVVAKLKGFLAPAPKEHLEPLHEAYDAARSSCSTNGAAMRGHQISFSPESRTLQT